MDHIQKYVKQVRDRQVLILLLGNLMLIGAWWYADSVLDLQPQLLLYLLLGVAIVQSILLGLASTDYLARPVRLVWQAVMHVAPDAANVPAPKLHAGVLGGELVANLVSHIYQLATVVDDVAKVAQGGTSDLQGNFIASALPLPLLVLDKDQNILFANKPLCDYIGRSQAETIGQNVYSVIDMSFGSTRTFDSWLERSQANSAVATSSWERVRLTLGSGERRQFDLAAYYNRSNPDGFETMLVFFDHTESYSRDDQGLGFVALAVHELRTPVTLLRGYIEALEEDLDGKLTPELEDFMHKMKAAAQSLTAFINNMLNVSRIENDQLTLKLHEEQWPEIIKTAIHDLSLRARTRGVELVSEIAPGLPTVGADRVGAYEVLCNLLDNAIKYSGSGKKVVLKAYVNREGLVETTVTDSGPGVPNAILPSLFEKFYRSHRSRNQVGGTGLGLYLSKSIVDAHGGDIWVHSKEGGGSTFGFTVLPYTKLAEEKKNGDNNDISRGAHGWIKNHSLYR